MSGWVCVPVATGCTIITQVCIIGRTVGMIMIWVDSIVLMFCGQALVTESGEQSGESGREEVGRWGLSTLLSPLEIFHWHFCYLTTLPPYHLTTLPPYHLNTLPPYHLTTLPPYHLTTKRKSVSERKDQWGLSPPHVWAGDSALLCLIYIIILLYMIVAYYIIISALCFDLSLSGCNVRAFHSWLPHLKMFVVIFANWGSL